MAESGGRMEIMDKQDNLKLETIPCPVCQTKEYTVLRPAQYPSGVSNENLCAVYLASSDRVLMDQLVQCRNCSLVYLNPRIDQAIILNGYKNAVDPTFTEQNVQRIKTFKRSLSYILSRYEINVDLQTRVLDIGCAGGAFPKAASDLGFSVTGVEPSSWLAEYGKKTYNLDIRTGLLSEQEFAKASFDIITLWDVIEHLTDPDEVIRQVNHLLKDKGVLIVNYPNYASLMRWLLGMKWPFFLNVHLLYFTPTTIKHFLEERGLIVEESRSFYQTLELGYVIERAAAYFAIFGILAKAVRFFRLHRLPFRYNMGQSLLIARKCK